MESIFDGILLDKSIVLDLMLKRDRRHAIISELEHFSNYYISTHTFATVFYVARKDLTKEQIFEGIKSFKLLEVDTSDCYKAYDQAIRLDDVEDCIELLTSKRMRIAFMTADKKLYEDYSDLTNIQLIN